MKEEWEIVISNKAAQEILQLTADLRNKFLRITELLIKLGPNNVSMPHIEHIDNKLWRIILNKKVNIAKSIYFLADKKKIILLHTFIKKTQERPRKAIEIAKKRTKEIP